MIRRLRASRRQIAHATRAARTRRLELEEMVASFALSGARPVLALARPLSTSPYLAPIY